MSKVLIFVEELYHETEFWVPYYRMLEHGSEVTIVAPEANKEYFSKHEVPVKSEMSAEEALKIEWDVVIIPGGFCPDFLRRNESVLNIIRDAHSRGSLVCGICHAQHVMASADILRGVKATCFYAIKDDIINAGAKYVSDQAAVLDQNILTSRSPADLPEFMSGIINWLEK